MLENVFSVASIVVADNLFGISVFTVILAIGMSIFLPKWLVPTSYPGGPRKPTTRHPKWKSDTTRTTVTMDDWIFCSDDNTSSTKSKVHGPSAGRQYWKYQKKRGNSKSFEFNPADNPNSADLVYRTPLQDKTKNDSPRCPKTVAQNGISFYQSLQCDDGHWPGDYGGPMFLMPGMIIMSYVTGIALENGIPQGMILYLRNHQQEDGGWGTHIDGASTLFGTVLSYVSLRLLGVDKTDPCASNARQFLLKHGGAMKAPSWAKFWLACLGVYDWRGINSIPCELWLLPRWFPFHPGRMWCHARMVYLPMSYLYGCRFQPKITSLVQAIRKEIYLEDYAQINWTAARRTDVSTLDMYSPLTWLMTVLHEILALYEKCPWQWLRRKGLQFAIEYIYAEDKQTNYVCIGPVNKTMNMLCIYHHDPHAPELQLHVPRLSDYLWVAEDGVKMQGYNGSQMWDTSFAVQAILDSDLIAPNQTCLQQAYRFMDRTQIREDEVDYKKWFRHVSKGGWPFSTAAHGWPISDCTAEGLKAMLRLQFHPTKIISTSEQLEAERYEDAVNVILTLQNGDGGWATYENNRGYGWYEWLNPSQVFGDIMIDYSYVECSSACISALTTFHQYYPLHLPDVISKSIERGVRFIQSIQRPDGSWYGSWGVCFTYGTWFGIEGLMAGGATKDNVAVKKACSFLLSKQREDGGWSESILSCVDKRYTENPMGSQVIQTAWALLGLMKGQCENRIAVDRGIEYLMKAQLPSGDWPQQGIAGVFNRNCGITYTAYRNVFPIWAIGYYVSRYQNIKKDM